MDNSTKITLQRLVGAPVSVTFPSDEDWIARQRHRRVVVRHLGRGKSETDATSSDEIDLTLLAKIAGGALPDDLDSAEAAMLIRTLERAEVQDIQRDGVAGFRVTLRTIAGQVEHCARIPKAGDIAKFRRSFTRVVDLPHGRQEISVHMDAAVDLYDSIAVDPPPFNPVIYKVAVAAAIAGEVDRLLEPVSTDF